MARISSKTNDAPETKIKLLFLIHTLQVGGAEKALVNLVNHLDKSRFDITVMTIVDTGAFRRDLPKSVHYKTIFKLPHKNDSIKPKKSGNLFDGKSNLKAVLAKFYSYLWRHINLDKFYIHHITEKYDLEIAFLEGISAKIIAHSNNVESKKIAWIHVDLLNERKSEQFFKNLSDECKTYSAFDKIIAVSQTTKEHFIKKFNFDPKKVVVKYNIIDENKIKVLAQTNPTVTHDFTICTVGRLSWQKGYDRLLRVIKRLNNNKLRFTVWIIGVGAEEGKLREYITKNKLANVKLLGYKSNPYPYINAADLYVCSSRAEGYSTTIAEALVLRTPIVTTDCSGMRELLGNSRYGLICENSEDALYYALEKVIKNHDYYQKLRHQIFRRQDNFNSETAAQSIEKIFQESLL